MCFRPGDHSLDFLARHAAQRGEKRPLVRVWRCALIEKEAVAVLARFPLQRQGDQIAQSAFRERILAGEEAVIGVQADLRPALHGLRQQEGAHLARQRGRNWLGEEEPAVPAVARTRALQSDRRLVGLACLQKRVGILQPRRFVEVGGQEPTGFVGQHGIDAHGEVAARPILRIHPQEMVSHHIVGDGQVLAESAIIATRLGLLAHAADPFVAADGLIALLARSSGFRSAWHRRPRVPETGCGRARL